MPEIGSEVPAIRPLPKLHNKTRGEKLGTSQQEPTDKKEERRVVVAAGRSPSRRTNRK